VTAICAFQLEEWTRRPGHQVREQTANIEFADSI
jgi:hypothetical protein